MTCFAPQPEAEDYANYVCDLDKDHLGDHEARDGEGGKLLASWPNDNPITDTAGGKITFSGEAWEWLYGYLELLVQKELCVAINGEFEVHLLGVKAPYDSDRGELYGVGWDEEKNDWAGPSFTFELFDGGTPTIEWVHVL